MEIKKLYVLMLVSGLIVSISANVVFMWVNEEYKGLLTKSIESNKESWDIMTKAMDLMNTTKEYVIDQKQTIDELSMMNLAWSLYYQTGNVSWLPQSPSEFENVTYEV